MRKSIVVVLLLGLVGVYPAQAKEAQHLTLKGDGTAYLDVEFDKAVSLNVSGTRMSYSGDRAGWAMQPTGGGHLIGAYVIRGAVVPGESAERPTYSMGFGKVKVKPGSYRIVLIADGPTEVTIPINSGLSSVTLEPSTPTSSDSGLSEFTVGQAGTINEELRSPVHIGPSAFAVSLVTVYSEAGVMANQFDACYTQPGADCEPPAMHGVLIGSSEGSSMSYATHYEPGELPAGDYDALQKATTAGSTSGGTGAWLVVNLS
jgi:hypothetical protein